MASRISSTYPAVALLAAPLLVACTLGVTWRYAAVTAATLVPLGLLAVRLRRRVGAGGRGGWWTMAAGLAVLTMHNAQNQVALALTGRPSDDVGAAVTLALGYLLLLAGGLAITLPFARHEIGSMVDATIIGLAVASLLWGLVLSPAHVRRGSDPGTTAYEMALVLIVTALVGMLLNAWVLIPQARPACAALIAAMCATILADVAFTLTEDPTTGLSTWWASALCVLSLLCLTVALAHPSALAIAGPQRPQAGITRPRLAFIAVALAVGPALGGAQSILGAPVDVASLIIGGLLVVALVVVRIALLAQWHAAAEHELRRLASRDELTGLANRRALIAHLEDLLDRVAAGTAPGAVVLYLDLDDFKAVNDTYGHATGDQLLHITGARILGCVHPSDLVARLGGDEFVVVLTGDPQIVGDRVRGAIETALREPVALGPVVASGSASIGVASVGPGERADATTVIARADALMYRAKQTGQTHMSTAPPAAVPPSAPPPTDPAPARR